MVPSSALMDNLQQNPDSMFFLADSLSSYYTSLVLISLEDIHRGRSREQGTESSCCRGQAALLTFCTCISLASVALVLTITFPDVGNNWFWITVLSPLATVSEVVVQGDDDQQVDQMRKELKLSVKGWSM
ncbi:hypothetical protein V6N12_059610 [Hibiscus sabdariffa]|uniref:Uncharacterized protein n=1 Tax=Hibiscus sabdariffa TaxID=183260 RepID=A0ABR2EVK5_9ROSI